MINISEVFETHDMVEKENLDVRTITMGISLLDCARGNVEETCGAIRSKILGLASKLRQTADDIAAEQADIMDSTAVPDVATVYI